MQKLIIDRNEWLRGEGSDASYLLRATDGKMCCLGIYALSCGLTKDMIRSCRAPTSVSRSVLFDNGPTPRSLFEEKAPWLFDDSEEVAELIDINDEGCKSTREANLAAIFARHGVEVEFIN